MQTATLVSERIDLHTLSLLLALFDVAYLTREMASLGPGIYVVVKLPVGGSKAFDIKHVLKREPRTGKA
jgi:hypothetical protein